MYKSLLWLGILGGAIPALAQNSAPAQTTAETPPVALPDTTLEQPAAPLPTIEDRVLVTGALGRESRERLPISADVIEREEIEARQTTAIADLLRTVPGLDVVRSGSAGKVTSLFTRGTESDHTLVLWDGIELNNPFFGGFDWGLLTTDGVERVEIVRGPFSALYGSDAIGGVVQVLTDGRARANRLALELGEDGYSRALLTAGTELGAARLDVSAHSRRSDGIVDNDFFDSDELTARARWSLADHSELGLIVRGNQSDLGLPFAGGRRSPRRTTGWQEREVAIPLRFDNDSWTFEGQLSRVTLDSDFSDPEDPFGFTSSFSDSTSQRARVVGTYRFDSDLWLAVGGEAEDQEVDSGSVFGPALDGAEQTTRAFFSQLFYAAGAFTLDLGLRHDDHDVFGGTTHPKAGVGWRLGQRGSLRIAYGEGFRAPSLGELFFPFSGNAELEPEESESYELGYQRTGEAWELSVSAFRNELENLIDFDFIAFRNVNVGRARTEGLELGLQRRWQRGSLRANASYLDAGDLLSGLDLLRRPEWRGSLVGSLATTSWGLSATVFQIGSRQDVDPVTFERRLNSSYQRLDLAVRYKRWQRFTPYARVDNVTDERYSEALGFPASGRQLTGGLSLGF